MGTGRAQRTFEVMRHGRYDCADDPAILQDPCT